MSKRKGRLREIFSKAIYADDPKLYIVSYRDFDSNRNIPLLEFVRLSENFELIPLSRISSVSRENRVLYQKNG
ncbi:MAG: DUF504 domain-containing protein [Nitrososphaeraceae archaeon]